MKGKLDIKIAFFDIDGTLTNSKQELTENTIETLRKAHENGIEIVLCSGRTNTYVCKYLKELTGAKYAISSNGAEIYDYENEINIFEDKMNFLEVKYLWNYCESNKLSIVTNTISERYANKYTLRPDSKVFVDNIDFLENENIFQVVIADSNYNNMRELEEIIKDLKNTNVINYSHDYLKNKDNGNHWFDIVKINVNKGNAIKFLLKELKIDSKDALCFGDSINDIDMFNACGIKVAMGNALDDIKDIATYVTNTNDDEGIAKFFDKYLL